jgi:UDP-N-acetylglucosamine/UDP-N-acetylgalactosamine diphosphorylase
MSVVPANVKPQAAGHAMQTFPEDMRRRLRHYNQDHVLAWWDRLAPPERDGLIEQLAALDLEELQRLHAQRGRKDTLPELSRLAPLPRLHESQAQREEYRHHAEAAFGGGQVAYLVVAGGQGTRLGFEHPKGMFPIGPVSGKSLFQLHAEKVLALSRRHGKALPLLIMTSSATHEETVAFFEKHANFGLGEHVHFFQQGAMPALDYQTGKLLLEAPGRLCLSPNGHGGTLTALDDSGLLHRLEDAGIHTVFYFQVDNPLTNLADMLFVGRHLAQRAEVSSKVLPKKHPKEKMGNYVLVDGRCAIIEYSDLPDEWAHLTVANRRRESPGGDVPQRAASHHPATDVAGSSEDLFFWGGNPAIHLFDVAFLRKLCRDHGASIPWHLAKKKVPYLDAQGKLVQPSVENALKFERFIFDTLPLAERWTVEPTTRQDDFEPVKNARGDDSPESARRALVNQAARWLEAAGVRVPRDAHGNVAHPLEISPLFALDAEELAHQVDSACSITGPLCLTHPATHVAGS